MEEQERTGVRELLGLASLLDLELPAIPSAGNHYLHGSSPLEVVERAHRIDSYLPENILAHFTLLPWMS